MGHDGSGLFDSRKDAMGKHLGTTLEMAETSSRSRTCKKMLSKRE